MDGLPHANDVLIDARSTRGNHTLDALVLAELLDHERCLHGELSDGHEHKCLDLVEIRIDFLDKWNAIGCGFTRAIFGFGDDVLIIHYLRDGLLLDW